MFSNLIEVRSLNQEACKPPGEEAKFFGSWYIVCQNSELKTRLEFELKRVFICCLSGCDQNHVKSNVSERKLSHKLLHLHLAKKALILSDLERFPHERKIKVVEKKGS